MLTKQKKKSFKPLYFVAGGVILLVALFLIFNSHSSSGNQQVKNVDSTNVNSTNFDSINTNNVISENSLQNPVPDSLKADSLYHLGEKELHNQNYTVAVSFFENAALLGNAVAMAKLGDIFCGGYSPDLANFEKAIYWYRKGAALNNFDAMYEYGLFLNGNNVSFYFKIPEEIINRDSAKYYWNLCHDKEPDIVRYKKTGP